MKIPSYPARLSLSLAASVAILASGAVLSAQVTQTETKSKSETRTSPAGTVQTSETRTTESVLPRPGLTSVEGVITRIDSETNKVMVRTKKAKEPIGFVINPSTKFTDLDGKPVATSLLVNGTPVTLFYAEDRNTLVAADLQVQRIQVPLPDGTTTLTMRETLKPGGKTVAETTTTRATTVNGVLTTSESGKISVTVAGTPTPVVYAADSATVVLDAAGQPVAVTKLDPGTPLSIAYVKEGDRLLAREITVTTTTTAPIPAVPVPVPAPGKP
ncbi:MAG: hypothetical protein V4726_12420 [Verrucomicrobiota bacterium]